MSSEYKLPDVGEGLTEAEIVSWKVKVGDTIEINDVVVEIETAKSLVELPSPYAGTVEALLVPEGETVQVGTPIIRIGAGDEAAAPAEPATAPTSEAHEPIDTNVPPAEGQNATLVGYGPRETVAQRRPRKGRASPASEAGAATQLQVQGAFGQGAPEAGEVAPAEEEPVPAAPVARAEPAGDSGGGVRVLAKPPVRKLAKDLGVDLRSLSPSGPDGTISRDDVHAAASGASPSMPEAYEDLARPGVAPMRGARETREPVKGVRKMMAQAMVSSAFSAPHVTEWVTVDVTATMQFCDRLRSRREFRELRVSPLLVLARAAMLAMRRTPEINSWWDEQAQEIVYKGYVNLGIAAATPRGLVVPNVKDADQLSLVELAQELGALTDTARAGRTQPAEMSGGTFTITNVGVFGVDSGTPIINPGESAILCFGAAKRQPWVVGSGTDERIEIREVCTLALSFDHRHIDGEKGSRFLADVAAIMEDPAAALLF
ncbi:MAG TPA: dihydrolipoamide acetyltransferase family protein [Marmoricola sp.]|nr:dihydrolipoamide acetyltransferase family protein [Marmoricola sp.]